MLEKINSLYHHFGRFIRTLPQYLYQQNNDWLICAFWTDIESLMQRLDMSNNSSLPLCQIRLWI